MVLHIENSIPSGDNPTANDSESNPMLKSHAYLTQTAGFVNAFMNSTDVNWLEAYVGTTSDPYGAGIKIDASRNLESGAFNVSFFVAKGKYFELRHVNQVLTINWTPLIAGGGAPIDQD